MTTRAKTLARWDALPEPPVILAKPDLDAVYKALAGCPVCETYERYYPREQATVAGLGYFPVPGGCHCLNCCYTGQGVWHPTRKKTVCPECHVAWFA